MWSDYITASTAIKITRDQAPRGLANSIQDSMAIEQRKPRNPRFFDTSRIQQARHSFKNRLKFLSDIELPWYDPCPANDAIRTLPQDHLNFQFLENPVKKNI